MIVFNIVSTFFLKKIFLPSPTSAFYGSKNKILKNCPIDADARTNIYFISTLITILQIEIGGEQKIQITATRKTIYPTALQQEYKRFPFKHHSTPIVGTRFRGIPRRRIHKRATYNIMYNILLHVHDT